MEPTTLAAAIGATVLLIFLLSLALTMRSRYRARRYALLNDSFKRLKIVVAELLEKVNDCDQLIKYIPEQESNAGKARLKVAASDLVTIVDCIPTIEQLLKERRLADAGDLLSASTRLIEKVMLILDQVAPPLLEKHGQSGGTIKLSKEDKMKSTDKQDDKQ